MQWVAAREGMETEGLIEVELAQDSLAGIDLTNLWKASCSLAVWTQLQQKKALQSIACSGRLSSSYRSPQRAFNPPIMILTYGETST